MDESTAADAQAQSSDRVGLGTVWAVAELFADDVGSDLVEWVRSVPETLRSWFVTALPESIQTGVILALEDPASFTEVALSKLAETAGFTLGRTAARLLAVLGELTPN